MKVIAAIDSFKSSAASKELNQAVLDALPDTIWTEKINLPISDGSEGSIDALKHGLNGEVITCTSVDPLGRGINVQYLISNVAGKRMAFIESASVIGIHFVMPSDETVRQGSSYGLGLLIKDAIAKGVQAVYLSLGGSGTSDGGLGLLQSLGSKIQTPETGNPLLSVSDFDLGPARQAVRNVSLIALADVTNPYTGKNGFAEIFGPQKGASNTTIKEMDLRAKRVAEKIFEQYKIDLTHEVGAGAAGGLGGAVLALGGRIQSGFQTISQLIDLEEKISGADLIFTGEGRLDAQTAQGKVPFGIAQLAKKADIPVIALCGSKAEGTSELEDQFLGSFSIQQGPCSLKEAMDKKTTLKNIGLTAAALAKVFCRRK